MVGILFISLGFAHWVTFGMLYSIFEIICGMNWWAITWLSPFTFLGCHDWVWRCVNLPRSLSFRDFRAIVSILRCLGNHHGLIMHVLLSPNFAKALQDLDGRLRWNSFSPWTCILLFSWHLRASTWKLNVDKMLVLNLSCRISICVFRHIQRLVTFPFHIWILWQILSSLCFRHITPLDHLTVQNVVDSIISCACSYLQVWIVV